MGIQRLLPLLGKSTEKGHLRDFRGCTVAIDTFSWLHKGLYKCGEELLQGQTPTRYEDYILHKIDRLHSFGLKPILVFDGKTPPLKEQVSTNRARLRQDNQNKAEKALKEGRLKEAEMLMQRAACVTHEMVFRLIELCRGKGVDYIVAPYEADAQLAFLNVTGLADVVLTEDSDVLAFGAKKVLLKCQDSGECEIIHAENLNASLHFIQFSHFKFKAMCIMAGCDYLANLPGVGIAKARRIASVMTEDDVAVKLLEIPKILNSSKIEVPSSYVPSFLRALNTFMHQPIFNPVSRKIQPLHPYPDGVDAKSLLYAGKIVDSSLAYQIALGNINPDNPTMTLSSFDPDKSTTKLSASSIWKKKTTMSPGAAVDKQPSSSVNPQERHKLKFASTSQTPQRTELTEKKDYVTRSYKVRPKYKRRDRLGEWKRNPKPSFVKGLALTMNEIITPADEQAQEACDVSIPLVDEMSTNTPVQMEKSMFLSPLLHYQSLLLEYHVLQTAYEVDSRELWETTFCFPDYETKKRKLNMKKYIFIKRRPIQCQNNWNWVYMCQCNPEQADFLSCLKESYDSPLEEVVSVKYCLHIECFLTLQPGIDTYYSILPEDVSLKAAHLDLPLEHAYCNSQTESAQVRIMPVVRYENRIGVLTPDSHLWGVCTIDYGKSDTPETRILCMTCTSHACAHVRAIRFELGTERNEDEALSLFAQALARCI